MGSGHRTKSPQRHLNPDDTFPDIPARKGLDLHRGRAGQALRYPTMATRDVLGTGDAASLTEVKEEP